MSPTVYNIPALADVSFSRLSPIQAFLVEHSIYGVCEFSSSMNISQFINLFRQNLEIYFPFLLVRIEKRGDAGWGVCACKNEPVISIIHRDLRRERQEDAELEVEALSSNQKKMIGLQIDQYEDKVVVKYELNHGFFDQGSAMGMLKNLIIFSMNPCKRSLLFRVGNVFGIRDLMQIKMEYGRLYKPQVDDLDLESYSLDQLHDDSIKFGLIHKSRIPVSQPQYEHVMTKVIWNLERIASYKSAGDPKISTNDIINAVFLKAIAFNAKQSGSASEIYYGFALDLRARRELDVPANAIGNWIDYLNNQWDLDEVLEMSVYELAVANRNILKKFDRKRFLDRLRFYAGIEKYGLNGSDFVPTGMVLSNHYGHTNWSKNKIPATVSIAGGRFLQHRGMPFSVDNKMVKTDRDLISGELYSELPLPINSLDFLTQLSTEMGLFDLPSSEFRKKI